MVSQHTTLTDGNGTSLVGEKVGDKDQDTELTLRVKGRVARTLGTFPTADLKAFARSL